MSQLPQADWLDKQPSGVNSRTLSLQWESTTWATQRLSWFTSNTLIIHSIKPITCHEGLISYSCVWCSTWAGPSAGPQEQQIGLRRTDDSDMIYFSRDELYQSAALLPCPPNLLWCDTIHTLFYDDELAASVYQRVSALKMSGGAALSFSQISHNSGLIKFK